MNRTQFSKRLRRAGFSLAESVISVGIASSALLTIIGLMAGTLGGARETRTETVAGMLARQMAAEARDDLARVPAPSLPLVNILLLDSAMQTLERSREKAGLTGTFQSGSQDLRAAYLARSQVEPSTTQPGMMEVRITVEAPASAPEGKRNVHRYVTLVGP